MAIELVIFDLDGTLVDLREVHRESLDEAISTIVGDEFVIGNDINFEGLPTRTKLQKLVEIKNFPSEKVSDVCFLKQELTKQKLLSVKENTEISVLIDLLRAHGIWVAVASNALEETIEIALKQLNIKVDLIVGNTTVKRTKPNPECFLFCMTHFGVSPKNTLIIEDSPVGKEAARASGAKLIPTLDSTTTVVRTLCGLIDHPKTTVIVPMAGLGSRFREAGYKDPKPFINVAGVTMIEKVIETLPEDFVEIIFLVQNEFLNQTVISMLKAVSLPRKVRIIPVSGLTEGAACTTLLAENYVNRENELLIANSDQIAIWNHDLLIESARAYDGAILTFRDTQEKWSYAVCKENSNEVERTIEKTAVGDRATCGVYYWKKAGDYFDAARKMIEANDRTKNEFYVCPVYNHAIAVGKKFIAIDCESMTGLGTPTDLEKYLSGFWKKK